MQSKANDWQRKIGPFVDCAIPQVEQLELDLALRGQTGSPSAGGGAIARDQLRRPSADRVDQNG